MVHACGVGMVDFFDELIFCALQATSSPARDDAFFSTICTTSSNTEQRTRKKEMKNMLPRDGCNNTTHK